MPLAPRPAYHQPVACRRAARRFQRHYHAAHADMPSASQLLRRQGEQESRPRHYDTRAKRRSAYAQAEPCLAQRDEGMLSRLLDTCLLAIAFANADVRQLK